MRYSTFWGAYSNKDYSILGSILGSPYLGKLPHLISEVSFAYLQATRDWASGLGTQG